ncbi:MAG: calcium-binding protein [Nostoc sp.]
MTNIIGTNGNDTLVGSDSADTINGKAGNDIIRSSAGNDTLTGGGGKDEFDYDLYQSGTDTITDFGGIGKGISPTAAVIAEVDTIKFVGTELTAQNLLLTQNGNNLEITFEGVAGTQVILQKFKLENLENLKASGARPAIGNILFDGQTSITDSFNVLDANSTETSIGIKNTVTFLNDLSNNITGLDNSDDVVNGQGGNDKIDGLSGNDILRGGAGNDTLIGGAGNDTLESGEGRNSLVGGIGDDYLNADLSTGKNTLNGGAGKDTLSASGSTGDNLLLGGDGNDSLSTSYLLTNYGYSYITSSGNNTLNGNAGDDTLSAESRQGNNFLSGGDGNDSLSTSGYDEYRSYFSFSSSGNNTLDGGAGNDTLNANYSTGNNLLSGGDGNDFLSTSSYVFTTSGGDYYDLSSGDNTLKGGAGADNLIVDYSTGKNLLSGGDGNDTLSASNAVGNNTLDGGNGNDILIGGKGNDSLIGGAGTDTFVLNSYNKGVDRLYDFNATNELIQVSAAGFGGGLSIGSLQTSQFTLGTSATTSNQRFIYDNITGGLYFDPDGSASGFTQVKFAQLSAGLSLTKNNFVVV